MQKRKAKDNNNAWRFFIFGIVLIIVILLIYINAPITGQALTATSSISCSDGDGGLDYLTKGICSDATGSKQDTCVGDVVLKEYKCSDEACKYVYYNCVMHGYTGCSNGACYSQGATTTGESSAVTYQGVLDMLNSCVLKSVKGNSTNQTCNSVCSASSRTCTQAYTYEAATQTLMPSRCGSKVNDPTKNLICNCCSVPGEIVYAPELQECCWLKPNGSCTAVETPWAECTGCGHHCGGVGGAVALQEITGTIQFSCS